MTSGSNSRLASWMLAACFAATPAMVSAADGSWTEYTGDKSGSRYLGGSVATPESVSEMVISWRFSLPGNEISADNPDLRTWANETTPVVIDGTLYTSSPLGIVSAVDGATGKLLWTYDSKGYVDYQVANLGFIQRGITYFEDDGAGRLVAPTSNGYLVMLDAGTGQPVESWGENGFVDIAQSLRRPVPRDMIMTDSPPIVCGGNIIPSIGVFDSFAVGRPPMKFHPPGDVPAFDTKTGERTWIFHNPPLPGEPGSETWKNGIDTMGGANMWARPNCDDEAGIVYLPFSTPANDYYGGHRVGDNLYAESLVAVDAKTGARVWHYQMVRHGLWDYDLATGPNLMDLNVDGRAIKAAVQVTKQGFVFAFDRMTGEPIWPIEDRPVPAGDIPGEVYSPTQPHPTWPKPFVRQGVREDDLIDLTPELKEKAQKILARYEYGELFHPPTDKKAGTLLVPGVLGGASWAGAGHNPNTGVLYVPSFTIPIVIKVKKEAPGTSAYDYTATWGGVAGPEGLPLFKPPFSTLSAIDMNTGEYLWQVPAGKGPVDHPAIKDLGLGHLGNPHQSFIVVTDNIIFLAPNGQVDIIGLNTRGNALIGQTNENQPEPFLYAYDAKTGEMLGEVELPSGAFGSIMSYIAGDKQMVVVPVGGAGVPSELVGVQVGTVPTN